MRFATLTIPIPTPLLPTLILFLAPLYPFHSALTQAVLATNLLLLLLTTLPFSASLLSLDSSTNTLTTNQPPATTYFIAGIVPFFPVMNVTTTVMNITRVTRWRMLVLERWPLWTWVEVEVLEMVEDVEGMMREEVVEEEEKKQELVREEEEEDGEGVQELIDQMLRDLQEIHDTLGDSEEVEGRKRQEEDDEWEDVVDGLGLTVDGDCFPNYPSSSLWVDGMSE